MLAGLLLLAVAAVPVLSAPAQAATLVSNLGARDGWSATQKLIRYGGDFSGKMSLKEGGGFCHEKDA